MHTLRRSGTITAAELSAGLRDYIVLDTRPSVAWERNHLPGSRNVQASELAALALEIDARLPAVIVSDDGTAAAQSAAVLKANGRDAIVLDGGYHAWEAAGGCVVHHP